MEYLTRVQSRLINILPYLTPHGTETFLYMMIGMAIGFVVGILPGLGGATTLALMLPFIYNMDPTTAFAFLLGSNAVTATTGRHHVGALWSSGRRHYRRDDRRWPSHGQERRSRTRPRRGADELAGRRGVWRFHAGAGDSNC